MFFAGLQDLQATAAQTRELLERQISGDFPQVEARLREHLGRRMPRSSCSRSSSTNWERILRA